MVPGNRAVRDARTTEKSLRDLKPRDSEKKHFRVSPVPTFRGAKVRPGSVA
jgi:hypothetical protein